MKRILLFVFLLAAASGMAQLQEYNHPELKWYTIETDHFFVHFHNGTERTARVTAQIAEDIYDPITSLYHYEPDTKVHFIIRDHDDNSNGAAFYYDNKVEIWAPAMDFPFRGTHNWLRNVITHEYSHIISLGAIRKMPRNLQAVYLQWMGYEKEKRKDVIHGYPNKLVSIPLPGTVVPIWFAEGMAQFQRPGMDYETWDTHRDMLLRTAVLEDNMQTLAEMSMFGKTSLGNERGAYNQGYGLTLYIAHQYGVDKIPSLVEAMTPKTRFTFSAAIEDVLHQSDKELLQEWTVWLDSAYQEQAQFLNQNKVQGDIIEEKGLGNFYAAFSPDGKSIAYFSSQGRDYISISKLWIYNLESGKRTQIKKGAQTSVTWSPDGKRLVYASQKDRNRQGSLYFDLYQYDLETKKETRLTRYKRARYPAFSSDGKRLAYVVESDGTSNLYTCLPDGSQPKKITVYTHGEQIFSPRWVPNSDKIIFSVSEKVDGRDVAVIDSTGNGFAYVLQTEADERDPYPSPDGQFLYYASDKTGIFNVYRTPLNTPEKSDLLTNVTGGAFMPAVNSSGDLVYTLFQSEGYKLARIQSPKPVDESLASYQTPYADLAYDPPVEPLAIKTFDDTTTPDYEVKPYKTRYASTIFLPRVMMDYPDKVKLGTYLYSGDFLDKTSLFGGVAANQLWDVDLFALLQYNHFYPSLYLEGFYQKRHTKNDNIDVIFDLMEVDLGADWRLGDGLTLRTGFIYDKYDASMKYIEQQQLIKFNYTYHIGNSLQMLMNYEVLPSTLISDIAPDAGWRISLDVRQCWNRFLDDFEVNPKYGTLVETYTKHNFASMMLDGRYFLKSPIKNHSIKTRIKLGLLDRNVDSFYYFYAGGLDGMRGYPFYSMEGRRFSQLGLAYRFPLLMNMNVSLPGFTLDDLFVSLYGDYGNAWSNSEINWSDWKRDLGLQVRLSTYAFYGYPMKFFWDASYGLDAFTHKNTAYGEEWRFYFGVLFGFLE